MSTHLEDGNCGTLNLTADGFGKFLSKRKIGGFIVACAPSMLLAVRADFNRHLHERNLLMIDISNKQQ
jgi:hypothetical protein